MVILKLTAKDALEALDGLLEGHQLAQVAGEDLGHLEGLGQETLDLTGARHRHFVLLGQLVHTQDGNDILQGFVVLQERRIPLSQSPISSLKLDRNNPQVANLEDFLHATGDVVVLGSHDVGVHDTGGGVQGVHGGVDTQLSDGAGQHGGGVQVSEGGGGSGVSQIVSGHVDGLSEQTSHSVITPPHSDVL